MRKFDVSALNVAMPKPHSPERYVELFRKAYRLREAVKIRGDYYGMFGALRIGEDVVEGYFYKFFNLDVLQDWFNVNKSQQAEPQELAEIRVPDHLKPHHQSIRFFFYPKRHRLIFVAKDQKESLSPKMAKLLLERLFADQRLMQAFGEIEITIEPSREQLKKIFAIPKLKVLTIEVVPPNPDDLEDAEREVMERMNAEQAQKMTLQLTSKHPKGLQPDAEHRALAHVAQSNGKVTARGTNQAGEIVNLSTQSHPLIAPVHYDPDLQTRDVALAEMAETLLRDLRN